MKDGLEVGALHGLHEVVIGHGLQHRHERRATHVGAIRAAAPVVVVDRIRHPWAIDILHPLEAVAWKLAAEHGLPPRRFGHLVDIHQEVGDAVHAVGMGVEQRADHVAAALQLVGAADTGEFRRDQPPLDAALLEFGPQPVGGRPVDGGQVDVGIEEVSDFVELLGEDLVDRLLARVHAPGHHAHRQIRKLLLERGIRLALQFHRAGVDEAFEPRRHHLHDPVSVGPHVGDDVVDVAVDVEALAALVEGIVDHGPVGGHFRDVAPGVVGLAAADLLEVRAIDHLREVGSGRNRDRPALRGLSLAPAVVIPVVHERRAHLVDQPLLLVLRFGVAEAAPFRKLDEPALRVVARRDRPRIHDAIRDRVGRDERAAIDEPGLQEKLAAHFFRRGIRNHRREPEVLPALGGDLLGRHGGGAGERQRARRHAEVLVVGDVVFDDGVCERAHRLAVGGIQQKLEPQRVVGEEEIAVGGRADFERMPAVGAGLGSGLRFGRSRYRSRGGFSRAPAGKGHAHVGEMAFAAAQRLRPAEPHAEEFGGGPLHRLVILPPESLAGHRVAKLRDLPLVFPRHPGPVAAAGRQLTGLVAGHDLEGGRIGKVFLRVVVVGSPEADADGRAGVLHDGAQPGAVSLGVARLPDDEALAAWPAGDVGDGGVVDRRPAGRAFGERPLAENSIRPRGVGGREAGRRGHQARSQESSRQECRSDHGDTFGEAVSLGPPYLLNHPAKAG